MCKLLQTQWWGLDCSSLWHKTARGRYWKCWAVTWCLNRGGTPLAHPCVGRRLNLSQASGHKSQLDWRFFQLHDVTDDALWVTMSPLWSYLYSVIGQWCGPDRAEQHPVWLVYTKNPYWNGTCPQYALSTIYIPNKLGLFNYYCLKEAFTMQSLFDKSHVVSFTLNLESGLAIHLQDSWKKKNDVGSLHVKLLNSFNPSA